MTPSHHHPDETKNNLSIDRYCQEFKEGRISEAVFRAHLVSRVPRRDIESYINLNYPEARP